MLTRTHFLVVTVLVGALAFSVAGCGGKGITASGIELTSDRSLILTAPGESTRVSAVVVDEEDNVIEGAAVRWRSSDPDAVSVTEDGEVVARTALGSALIVAEYQNVKELVTAVVVVLQPQTLVVPTERVVSVNDERTVIVLERTPTLEALRPGDIVVNGSENGFLSRIVTIEPQADALRFEVIEATIAEAVREMELSVTSPLVTFEEDVDSDGTETKSAASSRSEALSLAFECELETMLVNVDFDGLNVTPRFGLQHEVVYRLRGGSVESFRLAMVGEIEVDAALGALTLSGGVKGKITCAADLNAIPFLAVPIFGPIAIAATATPTLGTELEAQYAAATLTVDGLSFKRGERIRTGFGYDPTRGYFLIGEQTTLADEAEMGQATRAQEDTMTAKVEPFVGLNFGVGVLVGPAVLGTVDVVTAKLIGGFELMMDTPLDYEDPAYTGPRWTVFVGANADANELLGNINILGRRLRRLGLEGLESLIGIDAKLFEVTTPLAQSPEVLITANPMIVAAGDPVDIMVTAPRAETNSAVQSWGFVAGTGMALADGRLDAQQRAMLEWVPLEGDEGRHTLTALVFDDIFGDVDLPYAAGAKPTVDVGCGDTGCGPDPGPDPASNDCWLVDDSGRRVLRDGATYSFSRTTTRTSPNASSTVTVSISGVYGCHFFPSSDECFQGWFETEVVTSMGVDAFGQPFSTETQSEDLAGLPPPIPGEFCGPGGGLNEDGSGFAMRTRENGETTETTSYTFAGCLSTVTPGGSVEPVSAAMCCGDAICLSR
ncbi:MAG: hypothetical protein AAGF92_09945 [Myxococcota bacterium]